MCLLICKWTASGFIPDYRHCRSNRLPDRRAKHAFSRFPGYSEGQEEGRTRILVPNIGMALYRAEVCQIVHSVRIELNGIGDAETRLLKLAALSCPMHRNYIHQFTRTESYAIGKPCFIRKLKTKNKKKKKIRQTPCSTCGWIFVNLSPTWSVDCIDPSRAESIIKIRHKFILHFDIPQWQTESFIFFRSNNLRRIDDRISPLWAYNDNNLNNR